MWLNVFIVLFAQRLFLRVRNVNEDREVDDYKRLFASTDYTASTSRKCGSPYYFILFYISSRYNNRIMRYIALQGITSYYIALYHSIDLCLNLAPQHREDDYTSRVQNRKCPHKIIRSVLPSALAPKKVDSVDSNGEKMKDEQNGARSQA